jgi:hypothetical protein
MVGLGDLGEAMIDAFPTHCVCNNQASNLIPPD